MESSIKTTNIWQYGFLFLIFLVLVIFFLRYPVLGNNDVSLLAPKKKVTLIGHVKSDPFSKYNDRIKFDFLVQKTISNKQISDVSGKVLVTIYDKYRSFKKIKIGQKLKLTGNLSIPKGNVNPYEFNYQKYLLLNKKVSAMMFVLWKDFKILSEPEDFFDKFLYSLNNIKNHIKQVQSKSLNGEKANLLGGIILGKQAIPLSDSTYQEFITSGLAHIVAASGINVALLSLSWLFIASRLGVPYNIQICVAMIIIIFYSLLTGFPPSVMRASLMLEIVFLGKLFNKNANMVSILFFAALLLLLYDPFMINDVGFQLSFLTTFGLIVSIPIIQQYFSSIPLTIGLLVVIPFIAQLWATPIILYNFNKLSLLSVISNFFATPIIAVITYTGFLSSFMSLLGKYGVACSIFLNSMLAPFLDIILGIASYTSKLPYSSLYLGLYSIESVLFVYLFILLILLLLHKKSSLKSFLILIMIFIIIFAFYKSFSINNTELKLVFMDSKNKSSILASFNKNKNILINSGYRKKHSCKKYESYIGDYLHSENINSLDSFVVSNPSNQYLGCMPEMLEHIELKNYYDSGFPSDNESYNLLIQKIIEKNISYSVLSKGDLLKVDKISGIKILNPENIPKYKTKQKLNQLYFQIYNGKFNFLSCGYPSEEAFTNILKENIDPDIIHFNVYKSKEAFYISILEKFNPQIVVFTDKSNILEKNIQFQEIVNKKTIKALNLSDIGDIQIGIGDKIFNINYYADNSIEQILYRK